MADKATVVHIGENSPEQVAFKLLEIVAEIEGKVLHPHSGNRNQAPSREWVLDTYKECWLATHGSRPTPAGTVSRPSGSSQNRDIV